MTDIVWPETTLQPSLHALTADDWYSLVLGECACRGVNVADLEKEMEVNPECLSDIEDEALDRLRAAGYHVDDGEDTLLIYPKGYEPPAAD